MSEQYTAAQAADPATEGRVLADIANTRPDLRAALATNPALYPELLSWLASLGDPEVTAALQSRPGGYPYPTPTGYGGPAYGSAPSSPYPPGAYPGYGAAYPAYPGQKSRLVAGLLGIFLGGFGVHRFYMGYTQMGVIQLIVTIVTCGIGSLWGFIEGIIIIAGGMPDSDLQRDARGVPLAA